MKYWIITYGCQMNKSDSERIASILEKTGYIPASKQDEADLILVNMCSVRQSAVDRIHGLSPQFKKLKTRNKNLTTVLTGCLLKKDKPKFAQEFDLILDIKNLPKFPQLLASPLVFSYSKSMPWPSFCVNAGCSHTRAKDCSYLKIQPKYNTSFRAFLPITIGCNNFCSYCVVPYTRGPEISRPAEDILDEAKNLINQEFKEICLLGENVNSYRFQTEKEEIDFPKLLRLINKLPGDFWIRFTSSHPKDFSPELIKAIVDCQKVTQYINLPIQSGDNKILTKMNRLYTIEHYKKLVKKIRKEIPGVCLSTDVIVGFPSETENQFQNTVKLFKETKFDMAYIAQYSPRPGTAAAKMPDTVSHSEKERREKILTEILKQTALKNNKKYIGKTVSVLIEKYKKGYLIGKTKTYKTVKFEDEENLIGKLVKVKIIDALPWGLKGVNEFSLKENLNKKALRALDNTSKV